jgi:hypothetical protein
MYNSQLVKFMMASSVIFFVGTGCTTIQVSPLDPAATLGHTCIQKNPKVLVTDFLEVIRTRLEYHQVSTEVFTGTEPTGCHFILTYTALRSWDFTPFLSHAEVYLSRDGQQVAEGIFHLRGKGGYALTKYNGTKKKMDPVIDQLIGKTPATRSER